MVEFKNTPLTEEFWEVHSQNREEKEFTTCGFVDNYYVTDTGWFVLVIDLFEDGFVEGRYSIMQNQNQELWDLLKDFNCLRYAESVTLEALCDYMAVDVVFTYSENCKTHFATSIQCNSELHRKFSDEYTSKDLQKIMMGCYREQEEKRKNGGISHEDTI